MEQESSLIQQLRRTLSRMEAAMGSIHDALAITNDEGALLWCNAAFEQLCGTTRLQCLGRWIGHVLPRLPDGQSLVHPSDIRPGGDRRGSRVAMLGEEPLHVIQLQWDPIPDEEPASLVFCAHDISAPISYQQLWARSESILERNKQIEQLNASLEQTQQRLAREIRQCPVTGLANRRALMEHLEHQISQLGSRDQKLAVLFCDVNRFKEINDSHGHAAGDDFLIEISRRLQAATRQGALISRLGGDEFVIVSTDLQLASQAQEIAARIQNSVGVPWLIGSEVIHPSLSIGIAVAHDSLTSSAELLRRADLAMYAAKASQQRSGHYFDADLALQQHQSLHILQALRQAIEGQGLELHLQPIRHLASHDLICQEALVRLRLADGTLLSPERFLAQAEKGRLIRQLGERVLQRALEQLQAHDARGAGLPGIAINISPQELAADKFSHRILQACERHGMDPGRLHLDITESAVIGQAPALAQQLAILRQEGVKILLDDFGTAHSSFILLSELPLDGIKLDASITAVLGMDQRRTAVFEAAIQLCRNLNLMVIAEGIESEAQRQRLLALNCAYGQGYLLGAPAAPPS